MDISRPFNPLQQLGLLAPRNVMRRWIDAHLPRRQVRNAATAEDDLVELDARTLSDIGASNRLQSHAQARRDTQRAERDALRLGLGGGAWRHW